MTIIEDVGQKIGQHDNIRIWCEERGINIRRQKLNTGDYQLAPPVSCDTKQGMQEVYFDIVQDHERFKKECIRAQEDGTRLVILIEEEEIKSLEDAREWRNPRYTFWEYEQIRGSTRKPPVDSNRLVNMMLAMSQKYGVEWMFCDPKETGEYVFDILNGKR